MEKTKLWSSKYFIYIFFLGNVVLFSIIYLQPNYILSQNILYINESLLKEKDYLVYTTKCMIPNLDPWNEEIRPFYRKQPYVVCNKYELLTYVIKNDTNAILHVNRKLAKYYSRKPITCCYMNVTRNVKRKVPDNDIILSRCINFEEQLNITGSVVTVKCRAKTEVYSNVHAPITITQRIRDKINAQNFTKSETKPPSILIVGIDSISRLNFIRTMPRTHSFLLDMELIEYRGYNKMGDNTFPNLMAMLTGRNNTNAYDACNPAILGKLDKCNFLWKDFNDLGYVTAYGEDEFGINTFNYNKKGFINEPTDYYFRAYAYAANKLPKKRIDDMDYCTGPEMSGERILNLAKDFATTFKSHPYFGFFWMNSFSHNKINSPTRMDTRVLQFFEDLLEIGTFENTIIIFLSDHGLRFGKVRQTRSGWLEERLPYLYFWIPFWFQQKHPKEFANIKANANNVLTTPYDLYMTLQNVLTLSNLNYSIKPSQGCPLCKSLFQYITPRSCEDVGIDVHWCTCYGYKSVSIKEKLIIKASDFIVDRINEKISSYGKESKKCAKYNVSKILTANISVKTINTNDTNLLIILETVPDGIFESTVSMIDDIFQNKSIFSRLDKYGAYSSCVENSNLKLFCHCK